jgi:hypothetical protein
MIHTQVSVFHSQMRAWRIFLLGGLWGCLATALLGATVNLKIIEGPDGHPVPCRVHLKGPDGKPVRPAHLPFWKDHFVCPGNATLELPNGTSTYEIERGPEYNLVRGTIEVGPNSPRQVTVRLERKIDLAAEGWWSGELHVHRQLSEIELLMRAEDLHVAPVITWWNRQNPWAKQPLPARSMVRFDGSRFYDRMGGEDEREGGALMYFNLPRPLPIQEAGREYPSSMKFLEEARAQAGVWVDIEKPFWWDVPLWLASGAVDSIGIANNHMCRDGMLENEAWGKQRDSNRLPAPRGDGFWTQEIYYHILNTGLRIPPSAGSASGVLPNPVGYDRVYVYLDPPSSKGLVWEDWWAGLKAGRSFVSNGPLLRCRADGQWPGHVFTGPVGTKVEVELDAALDSRDAVPFLEIIKDGRLERRVEAASPSWRGSLGSLGFQESGWFLVRALTDRTNTFRFASTAPFYVEIGPGHRRISRRSVRFFLDWLEERRGRIHLDDARQRDEVLAYHDQARSFWEGKLAEANAD